MISKLWTSAQEKRLTVLAAVLASAACIACCFALAGPGFAVKRVDRSGQGIRLRDFPYPYSAMAALINDCDNTTPRSFERYHRFLNTRGETIYGPGLGLDISDSFFAYTSASDYNLVMTFFLGADPGARKDARRIERYIRCGWIDAMHTYGDFSAPDGAGGAGSAEDGDGVGGVEDAGGAGGEPVGFSRELGAAAYASLRRDGIYPIVWTDHGNEGNVQNFGSYGPGASSRYKLGDLPRAGERYHTDFTVPGGVKYVWDARHSSRFGYDFPLTARTLRDGQKVWSFSRYTGGGATNGGTANNGGATTVGGATNGGVGYYATAASGWDWYPDGLRRTLTEERLQALVADRQYGLFAQHMGFYGEDYIYEAEDVAALRLLAEYQYERSAILVAGTARLFEYATAHRFVSYEAYSSDGGAGGPNAGGPYAVINILSVADPLFPEPEPSVERLRGLTFYCDDPDRVKVFVNSAPLNDSELSRNGVDHTGRPSVSIRWRPNDDTDYTVFG
ncbi:MAG: hypothetical protein FWH01_10840 [Oscillospiraceae bacterium]|nr:hypothetical protein [Oscillospiraceae bacterium]